jgi:O-acetylhomoserine/O-acetylserine sulfhydrylase-like pyridoxal-dependent enzyme
MQMYGGSYDLFRSQMSKIGIDVTFIEDITSDKVKAALTPKTRSEIH